MDIYLALNTVLSSGCYKGIVYMPLEEFIVQWERWTGKQATVSQCQKCFNKDRFKVLVRQRRKIINSAQSLSLASILSLGTGKLTRYSWQRLLQKRWGTDVIGHLQGTQASHLKPCMTESESQKTQKQGGNKNDFIKQIKIGFLGLITLNDNFGQSTASCWYLSIEWPFTLFIHTYSSSFQQSRRFLTLAQLTDEKREAQWDEVSQIKSFGKWKKRETNSLHLWTFRHFFNEKNSWKYKRNTKGKP